ncbi:SulP family inorganic anion transporter [Leucobacter chromiireducens]|uniref:SulP family inorganic anion transporter n=1 Tax=Leucobacter chromiireducens TaxID=283877 RepID=UPI001F1554B4|nr:SulP family inorganic anion transporter [Leucobacter chromiireducens]
MNTPDADARSRFRRALRSYRGRFGSRRTVRSDLTAGLIAGVESVPDGLAAGLLAGVNPLHGLYGYLFGTLGGALATGSVFMSVQATGAMAVIISDVPETQSGPGAGAALTTLALLTGVIMLALGLAGAGKLVRFIPTAVLVGFINAVAVNIILGQLETVTGYAAEGANRVVQAVDTLLNVANFNWRAVLIGVVTVVLIILLERTRIGPLGMVAAIIVGSALAAILPGPRVELVSDVAQIPAALPGLTPPDLGVVGALIVPAVSLALVGLVQGAAISGSIPNPGGKLPDPSADFRGQGIANLAAGLFHGMPVGGSMSGTAMVRAAGARSALANLVAALVMLVTIVAFAPAIGTIAMPALAGLLILVGARTMKPAELRFVWRTGPVQAAVLSVTFVLTLLIPLQYAVLAGVGLAVVLHVSRQSSRVRVRAWRFAAHAMLPREGAPPRVLPPDETVVLVIYGSVFFAAAPVLAEQLPAVAETSRGSAVVLRLRGTDEFGSTFIRVIERYASELHAAGGTLILCGIGPRAEAQLRSTGLQELLGADHVFTATEQIGDSLEQALRAAARWRAARPDPDQRPGLTNH